MFVQVFQGQVSDADRVRRALEDWVERISPSAQGWLGSTAGVAEDGTFVGIARFESAEAARRNSARAMQGEWWSGLSKLFTGDPEFHDCSVVDRSRAGGSDRAGFVQVMQGRTTDVARLRGLSEVFDERVPDVRPDLMGFLTAFHDGEDGAFTQVAYFTSERDARAAEQQEPPADVLELLREEASLVPDMRYIDLRDPWLASPG
ncbi:hypothetical protein ACVGOW_28605 [Pseudonocardia saturnea]